MLMTDNYEGRLELTWTNKHLCLLAYDDGSYVWLEPSDYRVAEVRLLHAVRTVGTVGNRRAADNLLIRGDALYALTSLAKLPEFAAEYLGKVKLAYLDPPFNTQRSFLDYDDNLAHSVWLTMMRDRLVQLKKLLAPDGSIYVHCDASEGHYLKALMDEVFGRANFRTEITWKRTTAHSDAKTWSQVTDSIFFYTKSASFIWNFPYMEHSAQYVNSKYHSVDEDGRHYQLDNLTSPSPRPNMMYTWKGFPAPKFGWRYSEESMAKLDAEGRIWYPEDKSKRPRLKRYLDESKGRISDNLWVDIPPVNSQANEDTGFATQKPEKLLARIIGASTSPGDIVLDCFAGSATTAAVAHKMGRRWVVVEREAETIDKFALPRLAKVVEGGGPNGVTKQFPSSGDGGFRIFDVAPSMFEADRGLVVLADWMTNGTLAEATAAQLGFEYAPEPPFAGRKGSSRLAVVDGVVNEAVVRLIVLALLERELVVICGTALDPEARPILRGLRPGSTLRKIPAILLEEYRSARPRQPSLLGHGLTSPNGQRTGTEASTG
jgi:adenine-specific DNA-methyltransferase